MSRHKIYFEVLGRPIPQARHRDRGDGYGKYDPSAKDKRIFQGACYQFAPKSLISGPIKMQLSFGFKRPKNHHRTGKYSEWIKKDAPEHHIVKPDLDNLEKFVKDAFNGLFYIDDSQVWQTQARKIYGRQFTEITIFW